MDRILRRELDAIARDTHSGAAELTARAVQAIELWLNRVKDVRQSDALTLTGALWKAQRSMAPMLRLANDVALSTESSDIPKLLRHTLRQWKGHSLAASSNIAKYFHHWLGRRREVVVMTHSYSSTVLACLLRTRSSLHSVFCSESRPALEGVAMARKLAEAGITVTFCTDATLTGQVWPREILLVGADAILSGCFAAKVGTKALVLLSQIRRCPIVIAADTSKFWPEPFRKSGRWDWKFGPDNELWKDPPPHIDIYNLYFELTFFPQRSRIRFLTEKGWMTPARVHRELKKIRISPRLKELVD